MFPLDHIGIAVTDIDESIAKYKKDFGYSLDHRETLTELKVEVAFLKTADVPIEFVRPLDDSTTLARFIEKRGPGLHHICYRVEDIVKELTRFKAQGYELIDSNPRTGAYNSLIAFVQPRSMQGVLTELCQRR